MNTRAWVVGFLSALVAVGCGGDAAPPARTTSVAALFGSPAAAAIALGATPISVDERGVPRLLRGGPALPGATATEIAIAQALRLAPAWGVTSAPDLVPLGEVPVLGGTIVRLRQDLDGIEVEHGELHVFVRANGELVAISGTMVGREAPRAAARFVDTDTAAIARAVGHNYKTTFQPAMLQRHARFLAGKSGSIDVHQATAKKIWHRDGDTLIAAWVTEAYASNGTVDGDAFHTVTAADTGRVLSQRSLVEHDAFQYRVWGETTGEHHPADGPLQDYTPNPLGVPSSVYPPFVAPSLISVEGTNHLNDPWLPANATETNGNSVDAYTDFNAPDGLSAGDFRASVTAPGVFDRTYNVTAEPLSSPDQQMAAITELFYTMNWLHDFWYDNGFTETAANAQLSNYGRGGVEGDPLHAEAEDSALAGQLNNANMSTPADGMSPRMQVYLWTGTTTTALTAAATSPATGVAAFGPTNFTLGGTLALANDATAPATDACTALDASASGKIVVVDRGTCSYKTKALDVQTAGGTGMIVVNNNASTAPLAMGDDTTITTAITIPILSVTMADGATIKGALGTAAMSRATGVELDGDLDNSVVAHEFGHYVHHRLSDCGASVCSGMSEGWADFDALLMMVRDGDNLDGAWPIGIYSTVSFSSAAAYYGIRRAPYSVIPAINSLSFRHMMTGVALPAGFLTLGNNAEAHNMGEIWAETLFDAYISLQKAGTSWADSRAKMAKYVVAGLLMTPPDTTPTESRDALTTAAGAASADDAHTIALAFARHGMGSCAVSQDRNSADNSGIVESSDLKGRIAAGAITLDPVTSCDTDTTLVAGGTAHLTIPISNPGAAALTDLAVAVTSDTPGLTLTNATSTIAALAPGAATTVTVDVALDASATGPLAGDFNISLMSDAACTNLTVPLAVALAAGDQLDASATDTFDARSSVWTAAGTATTAWTHVRETALDGAWHGDDLASLGDVQLTSPPLIASATDPVTVTFDHTYDFELSDAAYDGGVIELSTDNGTTWADVTTLTGVTPGYTAAITTTSNNPIGGRQAFTGKNPANPATDPVTLAFGTQLAGQTFLLRFRIGSDEASGAGGWTIDNVAVTGITNTPFPALVANTGTCNGNGSDAGTGGDDTGGMDTGGCCDAGPLRTGNLLTVLGVTLLLGRRRRRR
ncbi:MAG: M36 family metallopeptidase [Kofleriaceae bacterium]